MDLRVYSGSVLRDHSTGAWGTICDVEDRTWFSHVQGK